MSVVRIPPYHPYQLASRIPLQEPPQRRVVVPRAVVVQPRLDIVESPGVGAGVVETNHPDASIEQRSAYPRCTQRLSVAVSRTPCWSSTVEAPTRVSA